jgi:hypothetical protein
MICKACKEAGEANAGNYFMFAAELHSQCKGDTWCCCQHVVGRSAKAGREPK